jgi:hypothetical protein
MKNDPILEEVWRVKDQLAAAADYDMDIFLKQLRDWSTAHPPAAPVVHSADELRRLPTTDASLRYSASLAEPVQVRETPRKEPNDEL